MHIKSFPRLGALCALCSYSDKQYKVLDFKKLTSFLEKTDHEKENNIIYNIIPGGVSAGKKKKTEEA